MIADLKPYAEYKESGLPWLGQVPGHWAVRRLKSAVTNVIEQTLEMSSDEVYVALEHVESWTGRARPQSGSNLFAGQVKRFRQGDVLFGKLRPYLAKVTRIGNDGVCAGEFFVLRPTDEAMSSAYLEHQIRAKHTIDVINGSTFGAKMPRADWQFCGNLPVPLPPPDEQAAVVRFLDWANGRLERAIRAKRKVIALLNEQKQAIIHRAVTRGLDPFVPLKPSGIPWLGDIPQHWEVTALRRYWRVTDCKHLTVPFVDEGIPLASVVEVQPFSLNLNRCKRTKPEWYRLLIDGDRKPRRGDLIYCRNASVGACALVETDIDFAMGQDVCLIRSQSQNQRFLNYLLHSPFMDHQLELLLVGSTFKRINISEIKALAVIVPPRHEQNAVCEALDAGMVAYDTAISRLEREIELLREYRIRLVADVVTGKLDVREAAARLPAEAPLDSVEDDADLIDETEVADEEAAV